MKTIKVILKDKTVIRDLYYNDLSKDSLKFNTLVFNGVTGTGEPKYDSGEMTIKIKDNILDVFESSNYKDSDGNIIYYNDVVWDISGGTWTGGKISIPTVNIFILLKKDGLFYSLEDGHEFYRGLSFPNRIICDAYELDTYINKHIKGLNK